MKSEPNSVLSSETNMPWGHTGYQPAPQYDPSQGFHSHTPAPPAFQGQQPPAPSWDSLASFPARVFNPAAPPPGLPPFPQLPPPPGMGSGFPGPQFGQPPPPFRPPQNNYGMGPPHTRFGTTQPVQQSSFGNAPPPFQNRFETCPPQNSFGASRHAGNNYGSVRPQASSAIPGQPPRFSTNPLQETPAMFPAPPTFQEDVKFAADGAGPGDDERNDTGAQKEVNRWLEKVGKLSESQKPAEDSGKKAVSSASDASPRKKAECSLSIGEAHEKLRSALYALAAVQKKLQHMEDEQEVADADAWNASVTKIKQLKEAYLKAKQEVDVEPLKALKRKVDQRRKKRERQKRRKEEEKEAEKQVLFERAQKHAAMDQWRDKILQEHLNQQEVKQMKETADKTLSKVRREIREARKMLDTTNRLQKLRAVRNDMAEKRGQTFSRSDAEHFADKTQHLAQLLAEQIDAYEKEEAALKLILETEKEEAKEKEKEEKHQKEQETKQMEMEEEKQSLFGPSVALYPGHPMQPFVNYYEQARYSLQSLQSIRQDWDQFLVPENTPMASRIPDSWVIPESPSSAVWATVLRQQSTSPQP
ncbi:hypothetical protein V1264_001229 [Littorina saxatilis]